MRIALTKYTRGFVTAGFAFMVGSLIPSSKLIHTLRFIFIFLLQTSVEALHFRQVILKHNILRSKTSYFLINQQCVQPKYFASHPEHHVIAFWMYCLLAASLRAVLFFSASSPPNLKLFKLSFIFLNWNACISLSNVIFTLLCRSSFFLKHPLQKQILCSCSKLLKTSLIHI